MDILNPDEYRILTGDEGHSIPIEEWFEAKAQEQDTEIIYDNSIQRMSYIQANIVAVFEKWFTSFFEPNYFKFVRLRTQSTFNDFKSFMKDIYKKDKPFLVIDPHAPEHVEDSIFGLNMINRYNSYDPENDNIGAKLLYSEPLMTSEYFELYYRRNRYMFEFDVMIMEKTLNRQINLYNSMLMKIRHNSKFSFDRVIPILIPIHYIMNIAKFHGYDFRTQEFLGFMNTISSYPIIKRIMPSGQYMFFMKQHITMNVEVPSYPSKDSVETSDQIEWGARVVDSFVFTVDLPSEFIITMPKEHSNMYLNSVVDDPDSVYFISPIHSDIEIPNYIGDFALCNRVDVMMADGDENTLDVLPIIRDINASHETIIRHYIAANLDITDLVKISVYENGSYDEAGCILDKTGVLTIPHPTYDKLYCVNIYVNLKKLNEIKIASDSQYVGTIEKY